MRRTVMFNLISLDGLFKRLSQEIDRHPVDEEFNEFSIKRLTTFKKK
jgi:hypothetical protein